MLYPHYLQSFALLNKNIKGEMIESLEFDQEASDVGVSAVPHIVGKVIMGKIENKGKGHKRLNFSLE